MNAERLLGLTSDEGERLFYVEEWPEAFSTAYSEASDRIEQAMYAAQRINFFIETGGTDEPDKRAQAPA